MGTTIGTRIYTWLRGELVGRDQQGNRYYRAKGGGRTHKDSLRKEQRWVIYNGEVEASRVPPDWHAWLHHTTDTVPPEGGLPRQPWQKEHQPNLTGTVEAYRPPGHVLKGGKRAPATGDYEPWTPN
ncbi:MAG: NADH:ubiquinone oxidoreductase subunit NDUFA12 [Kiloniellaceae bacterium]